MEANRQCRNLYWLILPLRVTLGASCVYFLPWFFINNLTRALVRSEAAPSLALSLLGRPNILLALALPVSALVLWPACVSRGFDAQCVHDCVYASDEALSTRQPLDRKCKQGLSAVFLMGGLVNMMTNPERNVTPAPTMPVACIIGFVAAVFVYRTASPARRSLRVLELWRSLFVAVTLTFWLVSYAFSGDPFYLQRQMMRRRGVEASFRHWSTNTFAHGACNALFVKSSSPWWLVLHFSVLSVAPIAILGSASANHIDTVDRICMLSSLVGTSVALGGAIVVAWKNMETGVRNIEKDRQTARIIAEEVSIWAAAPTAAPAAAADAATAATTTLERDQEGGDAKWIEKASKVPPPSLKHNSPAMVAAYAGVVVLSALMSSMNVEHILSTTSGAA